MAAEFLRGVTHEVGAGDGGGVHAALVGAGQQELADVLGGADAAADGERQKDPFGSARDDVENSVAIFVTSGDVQKGQFVGASTVVDGSLFDRVARVTKIDEVHAFDDPTLLDV